MAARFVGPTLMFQLHARSLVLQFPRCTGCLIYITPFTLSLRWQRIELSDQLTPGTAFAGMSGYVGEGRISADPSPLPCGRQSGSLAGATNCPDPRLEQSIA